MPRDGEMASLGITKHMDSNMREASFTSKLLRGTNQQILFLREAILTGVFNQKGPAMDQRQSRVDRNDGQSKASVANMAERWSERSCPTAFGKLSEQASVGVKLLLLLGGRQLRMWKRRCIQPAVNTCFLAAGGVPHLCQVQDYPNTHGPFILGAHQLLWRAGAGGTG